MDYQTYIAYVNESNPFMKHNRMKAVSVTEENAIVEVHLTPELTNSMGGVHAGVMFSLAEIAAGLLVRSDGSRQVTVDTSFRFLRNSMNVTDLEAEAVYIKRGRTITMCRSVVREKGETKALAEGEFSFCSLDK